MKYIIEGGPDALSLAFSLFRAEHVEFVYIDDTGKRKLTRFEVVCIREADEMNGTFIELVQKEVDRYLVWTAYYRIESSTGSMEINKNPPCQFCGALGQGVHNKKYGTKFSDEEKCTECGIEKG